MSKLRLWHYKLISVLPRQQLLGQWRELNSIYKKQDKHILINFVYDYPKQDLYLYSMEIISEFFDRNYKINFDNFDNYFADLPYKSIANNKDIIFKEKMNERYLKQCLYNLQEKYDCGGISQEEWQKIEDKFGGIM